MESQFPVQGMTIKHINFEIYTKHIISYSEILYENLDVLFLWVISLITYTTC